MEVALVLHTTPFANKSWQHINDKQRGTHLVLLV